MNRDSFTAEEQWRMFGELTVAAQRELIERNDELEDEVLSLESMRSADSEIIEALLSALEKTGAIAGGLVARIRSERG